MVIGQDFWNLVGGETTYQELFSTRLAQ
ncbi:MAG: hypothetical protein F6K03_14005 [Kamptonema sp. SIO4C4]|nr:hypothetical protein [Kamptonema sp. SIO4C4]